MTVSTFALVNDIETNDQLCGSVLRRRGKALALRLIPHYLDALKSSICTGITHHLGLSVNTYNAVVEMKRLIQRPGDIKKKRAENVYGSIAVREVGGVDDEDAAEVGAALNHKLIFLVHLHHRGRMHKTQITWTQDFYTFDLEPCQFKKLGLKQISDEEMI